MKKEKGKIVLSLITESRFRSCKLYVKPNVLLLVVTGNRDTAKVHETFASMCKYVCARKMGKNAFQRILESI